MADEIIKFNRNYNINVTLNPVLNDSEDLTN
jgi:hypothetical protein